MNRESVPYVARSLGPWRHKVRLGETNTFENAESVGPFADAGHPAPRARFVEEHILEEHNSVLDVGCNAGGVLFHLEDNTGVDELHGIDSSEDREVEVHPLLQAYFCKQVRGSSVTFEEIDAIEKLSEPTTRTDVILLLGILYHIRSEKGERNREQEEWLLDLACSNAQRVIVETDPTPWLESYLSEKTNVVTYKTHRQSRYGVRQAIVVDT